MKDYLQPAATFALALAVMFLGTKQKRSSPTPSVSAPLAIPENLKVEITKIPEIAFPPPRTSANPMPVYVEGGYTGGLPVRAVGR